MFQGQTFWLDQGSLLQKQNGAGHSGRLVTFRQSPGQGGFFDKFVDLFGK